MVISRYPVDHSLKEAVMEYEAITEKQLDALINDPQDLDHVDPVILSDKISCGNGVALRSPA
jgi:hypothetical protein